MMTHFVLPLLLLATTATPLFAEEKEEVRVRTVKLEITPATEPVPALKIELLPNRLDQTPGNAAPLYYQSGLLIALADEEALDKTVHWVEEVSPADLPRDDVRQALDAFSSALSRAELAARRSRCDWDLPIESEGFYMLLPELQQLRTVARVLALKAKLEIADGDFASAIHTLQTGYSMARNLSAGPTLVHGVLGIAIGRIMNNRLEEALNRLPAPDNLYWALTALPRPMIDLREAMRTEQFSMHFSFPALQKVQSGPVNRQQEQELYKDLSEFLTLAGDSATLRADQVSLLKQLVEKMYAHAKQELVTQGHDPVQVEAMPKIQAVTLHSLEAYKQSRDDLFRWFHVPFWQARTRIEQENERLEVNPSEWETLPFAQLTLPAVGAVYRQATALDQQIAMLRCVEAIRIYAAAHDRQLPGSLAEITEVPIPLDPVTGKEFHYEVKDTQAVLEGGSGGRWTQDRYEITIRPMQADSPSGNE